MHKNRTISCRAFDSKAPKKRYHSKESPCCGACLSLPLTYGSRLFGLFGTFLRFAPKNSQNKRFSDVFTQKINVIRLTTKTVFVSYLFLVDSIPGLSKTTSNQEAVFESPQIQIC
jgi:hypothetical protein